MDSDLQEAIEQLLQKIPPSQLRLSAQEMSNRYRREIAVSPAAKHPFALQGMNEYLAYLGVRLPATFAAVDYVLQSTKNRLGFFSHIENVLDVGSGPGVALWALRKYVAWNMAHALELQPTWISLAKQLWEKQKNPAPVIWQQRDMNHPSSSQTSYDLVMASYSLNELSNIKRASLLKTLWQSTNKLFIWIEPGRLECFEQIRKFRNELLQDPSATLVAPCTGQGGCPYSQMDTFPEEGPGWCHFSARLQRPRFHQLIKDTTRSFEDEKFCYLVVAKNHKEPMKKAFRIMEEPQTRSGHVRLKLCNSHEIENRVVSRSTPEDYRVAKELVWGSCFPGFSHDLS